MFFDSASDERSGVQIYTPGERNGVTLLVVAGVLSILGVFSGFLYYFAFSKRTKTFHRTNIVPYLVSLLIANVLQAIATILNARWVKEGIVYNGSFCSFQGGLKNAANVGTALWSFVIAVHVFNLLFLRWKTTRAGMVATLIGGWSAVGLIVTLGPLSIESLDRGPYFGVSGYWCWITDNYPVEQTYMEYFFEFLSAGLGFVLYALILLRVRGNLMKVNGRWRLRWIQRSQAWQLSFSRDMLDTAMLRVATFMVWYPVAYSLIIIPVALARLSSFADHRVPFWATITTDVIFNLTGLVNSILFISTRRILPDTAELPQFTTPRSKTMSDTEATYGVTPFALDPSSTSSPERSHSRVSQESEEKRKSNEAGDDEREDFDDVSLAHETVPAPEVTLGGVSSRGTLPLPSVSPSGFRGVGSNAGEELPPRQDSHTYSHPGLGMITVPTLGFAYPGEGGGKKDDGH
ncbi:hypothetical protein A7U60_g3710 [Sanghuangporus baumii]|uniref:Glucose receptor Git3 N-terminal domain-containing protein n=1 Tax=Sanghuangporus baumii TaxID=108892 RepID=A0A9Q5HZW6_SANBA|nr:hypothetical protein A7U60_g3710 [Sanghuangporus baumii]